MSVLGDQPNVASPEAAAEAALLQQGDRVGKYVVERILGSGGMGLVVAARHEQLGEWVAIKILKPKAAADRIQVERFVREARATARIKSEHVVRVLDAGVEAATGAPYLVMEYLEGRDLSRLVRETGALPQATAIHFILQVLEAVAAAHALGIVHRDLKPSNFFLTKGSDGEPLVKVLDFGISKAIHRDGETSDPKLTETQAVFGSPTYMSPEQIRSSKNVDPRTDIWSIGVSLYELLSGKLPFAADNVAGLLAAIIADLPYQLRGYQPAVPVELEAVVFGCLEKDPDKRIASAGQLASLLQPFGAEESAALAARIERIERGTTGNNLPRPTSSIAPAASPRSLTPRGASAPVLPVVLGTTGANASLAQTHRRHVLLGVIAGMVVGIVALGSGIVWALRARPRVDPVAVSPPSIANGAASVRDERAAPSGVVATAPSAPPSSPSGNASASAAPHAAPSTGRKGVRVSPGGAPGANAPKPHIDPAGSRY